MGTKKSRLVITGMGAVTPIGCGVENYWRNLTDGVCGVDRITRFDADMLAVKIAAEVKDFDVDAYMPKKVIHETDAFTQYAYVAAMEALGDGLPAAPERTGIVMGTAMAGVSTTAATQEVLTNAVHKNVGPKLVPRVLGNIAAAQIAIAYGICGPSTTVLSVGFTSVTYMGCANDRPRPFLCPIVYRIIPLCFPRTFPSRFTKQPSG